MVLALQQNETSSPTNPKLVFAAIRPGPHGNEGDDGAGFLQDVYSLTVRVLDGAGAELVAEKAVDLDDERLGVGRYAPSLSMGAGAVGWGEVQWTVVREEGGSEETLSTEFRLVLESEPVPDAYATVAEMREEGCPDSFSDARVKRALERGARLIERITHRQFEPHYKTINVDGGGGPILQVDEPIVAMEEVLFSFTNFTPVDHGIQQSDLRVYNRHIRENLRSPDDRNDPRIEFLRVGRYPHVAYPWGDSIRFADTQQNVTLKGLFGYTDPDGSPLGRTPDLIREANMLLAFKYLRGIYTNFGAGADPISGPVVRQKTRDQEIEYARPEHGGATHMGAFTGDARIDNILSAYIRPMKMGAP